MDRIDYYNKLFKENRDLSWNDAPGKKVILSAFVDLVKKQYNNIIDIGCGNGYFIDRIQEHNPVVGYKQNYHGIDISNEAVRRAKESYHNISFKQMDVMELEFEDKSFDVVISYGTLEHVKKPKDALSEIARILKDEGMFLIMIPCLEYRTDRNDEGWYEDQDINKQLQWNFFRTTWDGLFNKAGLQLFEPEKSIKYGANRPGVFFLGCNKPQA